MENDITSSHLFLACIFTSNNTFYYYLFYILRDIQLIKDLQNSDILYIMCVFLIYILRFYFSRHNVFFYYHSRGDAPYHLWKLEVDIYRKFCQQDGQILGTEFPLEFCSKIKQNKTKELWQFKKNVIIFSSSLYRNTICNLSYISCLDIISSHH